VFPDPNSPKILLLVCRFFLPQGLLADPSRAPAPAASPAPSRPPLRSPSVPALPVEGRINPNIFWFASLLSELEDDDEDDDEEEPLLDEDDEEEPLLDEDDEEEPLLDEDDPPKFAWP